MKSKKKKRRKHKYEEETLWECDGNFAMIMGYTSGGAPYGVTWEEFEEMNKEDFVVSKDDIVVNDEDLPF